MGRAGGQAGEEGAGKGQAVDREASEHAQWSGAINTDAEPTRPAFESLSTWPLGLPQVLPVAVSIHTRSGPVRVEVAGAPPLRLARAPAAEAGTEGVKDGLLGGGGAPISLGTGCRVPVGTPVSPAAPLGGPRVVGVGSSSPGAQSSQEGSPWDLPPTDCGREG